MILHLAGFLTAFALLLGLQAYLALRAFLARRKASTTPATSTRRFRRLDKQAIATLYLHSQRESCVWTNAFMSQLFASQQAYVHQKFLKTMAKFGKLLKFRLPTHPPIIRSISAHVESGSDYYFFLMDVCGSGDGYAKLELWKGFVLDVTVDFKATEWRFYVEHHRKEKELYLTPIPRVPLFVETPGVDGKFIRGRDRNLDPISISMSQKWQPYFQTKHFSVCVNDTPIFPVILACFVALLNLALSFGFLLRVSLRNPPVIQTVEGEGGASASGDAAVNSALSPVSSTASPVEMPHTESPKEPTAPTFQPSTLQQSATSIKNKFHSLSMKLYRKSTASSAAGPDAKLSPTFPLKFAETKTSPSVTVRATSQSATSPPLPVRAASQSAASPPLPVRSAEAETTSPPLPVRSISVPSPVISTVSEASPILTSPPANRSKPLPEPLNPEIKN